MGSSSITFRSTPKINLFLLSIEGSLRQTAFKVKQEWIGRQREELARMKIFEILWHIIQDDCENVFPWERAK